MAKCSSLSLQFSVALLILLASTSLVVGDQSNRVAETQVLLRFKRKIDDPVNRLVDWNESAASPCNFFGITCDGISGAVTGISLSNSSLFGEIDPSICDLSSLNSLLLGENNLTGVLPPELSRCINLQFLNLSLNRLTGPVPDLSPLKSLKVLDLSTNHLRGKFPSWVGNLSNLVSLGLGENEFDKASIPETIGDLKNLTLLFLGRCNLVGEIPFSIFGLNNLETFDLSRNNLSGTLLPAISNLRNLTKFLLYGNNFSGELPHELGNLTLLSEFDISTNRFTGKLPDEIGNLKNLKIFHLYHNCFWGELPQAFGDLQFLTSFSVYENNFWGEFPKNLGRFSPLDTVDISENNFTGPFPQFLCQNRILRFLLALDNNFSGELPDTYGDCKTLIRFRVSKNKLVGRIPESVWGMPSAVIVDFSYNAFTGGISPQIGLSSCLNLLNLERNHFSGEIPPEIGNLSLLGKLYAFDNSFSGTIPPQIGKLRQLTSLHLEGNSLSGGIPMELGECERLVDLDLAGNSLGGQIPETLSFIASLNTLNLSRNRLTGSIPRGLEQLKLSSLDLSENQLSGSIPPGLLLLGGNGAFSGNPGLCTGGNPSACNFDNGRKNSMVIGRLILVSIVLLTLIVLLACLVIVARRSFKHNEFLDEEDLDVSKWKTERFHPTEFDEEELKNLKEENLIGSGSAGKVYRLDLKKSGRPVAVKQLWKGPDTKAWTAEMEILGKVKHRNIVKLYACVSKGASKFLILEYMANGNLREALRLKAEEGKTALNWWWRHKIAVGIAKGIMYLHHDCSPAIIHRDIKSTNILLDENYEPKIADFGISRVTGDANSTRLAGTLGYMAPELAYSKNASEKSDVYSFGVVLLELVTGRCSIEEEYGQGRDIVHWVSTRIAAGKTMGVLDLRIPGADLDSMIQVLKIATLCTTTVPSWRPTMRHVMNLLVDSTPRYGAQREN